VEFFGRIPSTAKRNWPLCLAGGVALGLLAAAFIEGAIIAEVPQNTDVIQDYATVKYLPNVACLTSVAGFAFFIVLLIGPALLRRWRDEYNGAPAASSTASAAMVRSRSGYFTPITLGWTEVPTPGRGHIATHVLIAGLALFASAVACLFAFAAAFAVPSQIKKATLNGYTYHLIHHVTGDGDTMEAVLYECTASNDDCHVIYQINTGGLDVDELNMQADPAADTILVTYNGSALFEHQPPTTSARPAPDP
jgi:hypothetical protein